MTSNHRCAPPTAPVGRSVAEVAGDLATVLDRLAGADRSTILTAADVLRSMPATAGLWQDGVLSWGQVRDLCLRAAKLRAGDREGLDRRIAATAGEVDAYGPDGLLDAAPAVSLDATRAERLATGLKRICADHLAGRPGRRAKPLVNVQVDLS